MTWAKINRLKHFFFIEINLKIPNCPTPYPSQDKLNAPVIAQLKNPHSNPLARKAFRIDEYLTKV